MARGSAAQAQLDAVAPPPPGGGLPPSGPRAGYGVPFSEHDEAAAVRHYMPLVKRSAMHLKGRLPDAVQLDDLIQAGLIAVLRLLRSGAGDAGSAAVLRRAVVNAMIDEARREAWAPVRTVRQARAAAAAMGAVRQRLGRDGSDEEVAAEMGVALADYHRVLIDIAGMRLHQIDAFDERAETELQVAGSQETSLVRARLMTALAGAVATLPDREKLVVSLYYEHELNMEEVGKVLGLDKSTVCRAHGRALLLLRRALDERDQVRDRSPVAGG
ncbi:MAG TPA: sigma-70 family RNA polymerase sigma factor [Stellaceae bacterium]|nr:sigma-70 family RNA polymerase sigma factor [Stellaceae bacterium]